MSRTELRDEEAAKQKSGPGPKTFSFWQRRETRELGELEIPEQGPAEVSLLGAVELHLGSFHTQKQPRGREPLCLYIKWTIYECFLLAAGT